MDPEKTCQDQPEKSLPCIRETMEGCKTCTHWTYIDECRAVSGEGDCSMYHFNSATGQCKNAGGWDCYEALDDNLGKFYSSFNSPDPTHYNVKLRVLISLIILSLCFL